MEKIILSEGLEISEMSIGCWSFGGGSYWGQQSQADCNQVVHSAIERGIRLFDTAEIYNDGASEEALGKALKGIRNQAVIMDKIPADCLHKEDIQKHCEDSLRRLDTEYIDLYAPHWPLTTAENPASCEECFEALMRLKKQGKIRHIALSNFGKIQMDEIFDKTTAKPVLNELLYNVLSRAIEDTIVPDCQKHGIGVLAYLPVNQGILTGKYKTIDDIPVNQTRTRHFDSKRGGRHGGMGAEQEVLQVINDMMKISKQTGYSMVHLALSYAIQKKGISSVLVGCRNRKQLEENAAVFENPVPVEIVQEMDRISEALYQKLGTCPDYYESQECSRIF